MPLEALDLAQSYAQDGFVVVDGVFSAAECDALKAEAKRLLQCNGASGKSLILHASVVSALCRELARDPRLVNLLKPLLPTGVKFSHNRIAFKSGQVAFATPWHTDAFYWAHSHPKISLWISLDDVGEHEGALWVVRGSHREDWTSRHVEGTAANVDEFPKYIARRHWPETDEICCAVGRGGLVVFGDRTIHGTRPNTSGRERYSIICVYQAPAPDDAFDLQCPGREVLWQPERSGVDRP